MSSEAPQKRRADGIAIKKSWIIIGAAVLSGVLVISIPFCIGAVIGYRTFSQLNARMQGNDVWWNTRQAVRRSDVSEDDDPSIGPANAKVVIVAFDDIANPDSKRRQDVIMKLLSEHPNDIRYVYRNLPKDEGVVESYRAALVSECAYEQGRFWEMYRLLVDNSNRLDLDTYNVFVDQIGLDQQQFQGCFLTSRYADEIAKDVADAKSYGVEYSPGFFVNGIPVGAFESADTLRIVVEHELGQ